METLQELLIVDCDVATKPSILIPTTIYIVRDAGEIHYHGNVWKAEQPYISPTGVTIYPSTISIYTNDDCQLEVEITPMNVSNKTIIWSSDNTAIATVDATGKVTAVAIGTATITVKTVNGYSATCVVTVESPPPEDGTEQYPYLIKNVNNFVAFRNAISEGETFDGIWHKLVNDIDLTGISFIPVVTGWSGEDPVGSQEVYKGNFEGNCKKIKNFFATDASYGLFYENGGIIQNLGVENISIIVDSADWEIQGTGGITAYNSGIIRQCYVTGIIITCNGINTGGIAGRNRSTGQIYDCWTDVIITSLYHVSGIADGMNFIGTVDKCYALGDLISNNTCKGISPGDGTITNSVAAMAHINIGGRIFYPSIYSNINNYALNTMLVNGVTVTSSDPTSYQGKDVTISQLKSLAFYRDVMGWDMENVWEIDDGNDFPKLRGF